MKTPTFSVIIPVYNVENYLEECICSVINQKFADYELILVDDGSTDSSGTICDRYADENDKIRVIHKQNEGQSDARNVGLQQAKGEYVCFVDSDDYWDEEAMLETLFQKAKLGVDVILFKFKKYFENRKRFSPCSFSFDIPQHITNNIEKMLFLIDNDAFYTSPWSKCIKRSVLMNNGIEFEKGLLGEDNDWYYKVIEKAESYETIDEVFIVYRQRGGSITKSGTIKNLLDLLYIIEKWSVIVADRIGEDLVYEVIQANLAKQYCNLLIGYSSLNDVSRIAHYHRIIKLKYLLKYSKNKRVLYFRMASRFVGIKGAIAIVKLIRRK